MINCNVIRDILPLYAEDMVCEDTRTLVDEHLESCGDCRNELERLRCPAKFVPDMDAAPLEHLKKRLRAKRVHTIIFTVLLVLAAAVSVFAVLSAPNYLPYDESIAAIVESSKGKITVSFAPEVTGYSSTHYFDREYGTEVYHIDAWNTSLDSLRPNRGRQNMVINSGEAPVQIFYAQNNGQEDIQVYGPPMDYAGTITLPRLILGPYFLFALLILLVLTIARFLLHKREKQYALLDKAIPLPLSYMLAQLITKGTDFTSYSVQRDLCFIIFATVLLYCAALIGMGLYKAKILNNKTPGIN